MTIVYTEHHIQARLVSQEKFASQKNLMRLPIDNAKISTADSVCISLIGNAYNQRVLDYHSSLTICETKISCDIFLSSQISYWQISKL